MLRKENLLVLTKKEYYNLSWRQEGEGGRLTRQQEIQVLLQYLEDHAYHATVQYEHAINEEGEKIGVRVV